MIAKTTAKLPKIKREKLIPTFSPRQMRAIRSWLGIEQAELAEMLGIGVSTLYEWERGGRLPKNEVRAKVAKSLKKYSRIKLSTRGWVLLKR